jgi:hypothetical protein
MARATRSVFICLLAAVAAMATEIQPLLAKESGLTCMEKYRAAKATGKLKHGVTQAVFMDKCTSENRTRSEQAHQARKPRRG